MIKAIIFDFDGTLSNRTKHAYLGIKEFLKPYFKMDYNSLEYESIVQDMLIFDMAGMGNFETKFETMQSKYGLTPTNSKELYDRWTQEFPQYTCPQDDVYEALDMLKSKGYKLAILSNGEPDFQRRKINSLNFNHYFDEIMVSGDIHIDKPDSRVFDEICKRLNLNNDECLYVGDNFRNDIYGALNAGLDAIWINTNLSKPTLNSIKVIRNLLEITKYL